VELLPVIYWSLFSVGILALIVIIISFITFKFRKKYGNIPSSEVVGKERNKKITVTNPDKKPKLGKKHHPKVQTRSKNKSSTSTKHKSKKKTDENANLYRRPTRDSQNKRIEVLNSNAEKSSSQGDSEYHSMQIKPKRDGWK